MPLDLAELSRERSLWSSSSLAAQPVPSLPLQGAVLEDCGALWVFLRGFFVREALQGSSFRAWRHLSLREPRSRAAIGITYLQLFFPGRGDSGRKSCKLEGALAAANLLWDPFLWHW